jgi:beta-galactosidase
MIETPLRPRIAFEDGWEFIRQRVGRSWLKGHGGGGRPIHLPHCWNASDTFQYGRASYSGWGAYRRYGTFPTTSADGGILWNLRLGGFYGVGDVWFDGRRLARVDGRYIGATIGLPPFPGTTGHLMAIRLDNRWHRNVLPGFRQPDFILHGGLAGGAWLEGLPDRHFDVDRTRVECGRQKADSEQVTISWALAGARATAGESTVEWRVTDAHDQTVGAAPTWRGPSDAEPRSTTINLPNPRCWSPEDPALYWAEGRLVIDGAAVDVVRIRFGVTRAEFRPRRGFFLDGVRVDLHGCNRHEAIPGLGSALPDELQRRDAHLLKDLGCNFVRLSHYPQSPVFLDACDELGIMVYAEIATWKSVRSARGWRRAARRQMQDLIIRDRHHPSVIVWGMGNESRSRKAYLELRSIARELDPQRPVTYAENHIHRARREGTIGIPDVWGVNYELDVLEEACASSRLENVLLSECCNHPESVRGDDREELIQVATLEQEWEQFADLPYVAGHTVWSFADYATEHRNRFRRLNGLLDAWRRPKMAAQLFRARFAAEAFVALFVTQPGPEATPSRYRMDHRDSGDGRAPLELHAFTNCETLRLARDGSMLAVLEGALHHVIPLFGGFEEIIATASQDGTVVQDRLRRSGEAQRIHLRTASVAPTPTVEVEVEILDDSNTVVDTWDGVVHLTVDGPGRFHSYNDASEVVVVRGTGRAYLTVDSGGDGVVVTASAPDLSPAILSLHGV